MYWVASRLHDASRIAHALNVCVTLIIKVWRSVATVHIIANTVFM